MEEAILPLGGTRENSLFAKAIPVLPGDVVRKRAPLLLRDADHLVRLDTLYQLTRSEGAIAYLDLVFEWMRGPGHLDMRLDFASIVRGALPREVIRALVREGVRSESPEQRESAFDLATLLPATEARRVWARELRTEPDPALRKWLTKQLAADRPGAKASRRS